jgi:para-nitrobenzyl esterase
MQPFQVVRSLLLLSSLLGSQACANDVVRTQNGDVRGVTSGQVQSFLAIPYAAPPVGELRWMPPREPADWTGIRDASNFSLECPQMSPGANGQFIGDEDCLYLNVFKPLDASGLPVIVFIHGGSNVRGSAVQQGMGKVRMFDGSSLARRNVVVVTINYRLGTLGLIGHPKLSKASAYGGSGNYGYMDQIQALKWIQRNITAFGGDPGNVTIFGQSAGAKGVWVHMTSPLSKGLFHRAIVNSAVREGANGQDFADRVGGELSQKLNCSSEPDELACMRSKPAKQIVEAMPSSTGSGKYGAVIDNYVLYDTPIAIMQRGQHHHVPILQGNVDEEMSTILGWAPCGAPIDGLTCPKTINNEADYETAVKKYASSINGTSASELLGLYPSSDYRTPAKAYLAMRADREYMCPSRRVLRAISGKQKGFIGRFLYTHTYSSGPSGPPATDGPSHGFELLFIFDTLKAAGVTATDGETTLVKNFEEAWSTFARTGTPAISWNSYDPAKDNYLVFDTTMLERDNLRTRQCDYWDKFANAPN